MQLQLADTDPLPAETIGDAVDVARRRAIAEQMRVAGQDIEENRLGQAAQTHQLIDESLAEMLDVLAGRRTHELSRLIRKLRETESELGDAINQTKGLAGKLRQVQEASPGLPAEERTQQLQRLTAEQQQLQEKVERLARQLMRLQAERAGEATGRAAEKLGAACQTGQGGNQQSALEQTQDAQKDLEDAQQQLQQQLRQLEQDLLQEQFARLEQQVESLRGQQQSLLEETRRLRELEVQQGRLTRGQAESARDLARQQRALADETLAFAESFAEAPVFHAALTGAAGDMNRSAARLARRLLDDTTERIQQAAIERLGNLLDALKPDQQEGDAGEPGGGGQGGAGAGGGGGGRVTSLVELKLLKTMQEDLYRRTVELHEARQRRGDDMTEEMLAELTELAQEQGRLAQLLLDLSEPPDTAPEDDPETLPDIRKEDSLDREDELKKSF
jgi:DNA repair exonuclease SbcCD ATPase subunit